jgi:hypothetical protein
VFHTTLDEGAYFERHLRGQVECIGETDVMQKACKVISLLVDLPVRESSFSNDDTVVVDTVGVVERLGLKVLFGELAG